MKKEQIQEYNIKIATMIEGWVKRSGNGWEKPGENGGHSYEPLQYHSDAGALLRAFNAMEEGFEVLCDPASGYCCFIGETREHGARMMPDEMTARYLAICQYVDTLNK